MVGYLTSSSIYNACIQTLHEEELSFERRNKIQVLATTAMEAMDKQGRELLNLVEIFYSNRARVFAESLSFLEDASNSRNVELFTEGLNQIAVEMGDTLQFKNFTEFSGFMLDKDSVLEF